MEYQMDEHAEQIFKRMLAVNEVPAPLKEFYYRFRKVRDRVIGGVPMHADILLLMTMACGYQLGGEIRPQPSPPQGALPAVPPPAPAPAYVQPVQVAPPAPVAISTAQPAPLPGQQQPIQYKGVLFEQQPEMAPAPQSQLIIPVSGQAPQAPTDRPSLPEGPAPEPMVGDSFASMGRSPSLAGHPSGAELGQPVGIKPSDPEMAARIYRGANEATQAEIPTMQPAGVIE